MTSKTLTCSLITCEKLGPSGKLEGFHNDSDRADITPSALGLHLYARCNGYAGSPLDYFNVTELRPQSRFYWNQKMMTSVIRRLMIEFMKGLNTTAISAGNIGPNLRAQACRRRPSPVDVNQAKRWGRKDPHLCRLRAVTTIRCSQAVADVASLDHEALFFRRAAKLMRLRRVDVGDADVLAL